MPKTDIDFWSEKFRRNQQRDALACHALQDMGWIVIVVWECETKQNDVLNGILARAFH